MKTILFIDYTIAILIIGLFLGPYFKGFLKEMFTDLKPMRQNIRPDMSNTYWKNKHTNLCDNCKHHPAVCHAIDLDFGNGTGNDNVVKCDYHETKQSLIERWYNKYFKSNHKIIEVFDMKFSNKPIRKSLCDSCAFEPKSTKYGGFINCISANATMIECKSYVKTLTAIERLSNKYIVYVLIGLVIIIGVLVVVLTY